MMHGVVSRLLAAILMLIVYSRASAQSSLLDSVINEKALDSLVRYLASDSMQGRLTGTVQNWRAAQFIAGEFEKAGLRPFIDSLGYYIPFERGRFYNVNISYSTGYNVVGVLPGKTKPRELIIFSAHYDHVGTSEAPFVKLPGRATEAGDDIYNGANDNASGVTGLIALARYFGRLNNNERTIVFIGFSGEELGLHGSTDFARKLNPRSVVALINIEMIGRGPDGSTAKPYITGAFRSSLRNIMNKELSRTDRKTFGKWYFDSDSHTEDLFARSDNYAFALRGVPAHTVMVGSVKDIHYHSVQDEVETLNISLMTKIVQAIALASAPLISGQATPTRIYTPSLEN